MRVNELIGHLISLEQRYGDVEVQLYDRVEEYLAIPEKVWYDLRTDVVMLGFVLDPSPEALAVRAAQLKARDEKLSKSEVRTLFRVYEPGRYEVSGGITGHLEIRKVDEYPSGENPKWGEIDGS